jgi:hypothetical protein
MKRSSDLKFFKISNFTLFFFLVVFFILSLTFGLLLYTDERVIKQSYIKTVGDLYITTSSSSTTTKTYSYNTVTNNVNETDTIGTESNADIISLSTDFVLSYSAKIITTRACECDLSGIFTHFDSLDDVGVGVLISMPIQFGNPTKDSCITLTPSHLESTTINARVSLPAQSLVTGLVKSIKRSRGEINNTIVTIKMTCARVSFLLGSLLLSSQNDMQMSNVKYNAGLLFQQTLNSFSSVPLDDSFTFEKGDSKKKRNLYESTSTSFTQDQETKFETNLGKTLTESLQKVGGYVTSKSRVVFPQHGLFGISASANLQNQSSIEAGNPYKQFAAVKLSLKSGGQLTVKTSVSFSTASSFLSTRVTPVLVQSVINGLASMAGDNPSLNKTYTDSTSETPLPLTPLVVALSKAFTSILGIEDVSNDSTSTNSLLLASLIITCDQIAGHICGSVISSIDTSSCSLLGCNFDAAIDIKTSSENINIPSTPFLTNQTRRLFGGLSSSVPKFTIMISPLGIIIDTEGKLTANVDSNLKISGSGDNVFLDAAIARVLHLVTDSNYFLAGYISTTLVVDQMWKHYVFNELTNTYQLLTRISEDIDEKVCGYMKLYLTGQKISFIGNVRSVHLGMSAEFDASGIDNCIERILKEYGVLSTSSKKDLFTISSSLSSSTALGGLFQIRLVEAKETVNLAGKDKILGWISLPMSLNTHRWAVSSSSSPPSSLSSSLTSSSDFILSVMKEYTVNFPLFRFDVQFSKWMLSSSPLFYQYTDTLIMKEQSGWSITDLSFAGCDTGIGKPSFSSTIQPCLAASGSSDIISLLNFFFPDLISKKSQNSNQFGSINLDFTDGKQKWNGNDLLSTKSSDSYTIVLTQESISTSLRSTDTASSSTNILTRAKVIRLSMTAQFFSTRGYQDQVYTINGRRILPSSTLTCNSGIYAITSNCGLDYIIRYFRLISPLADTVYTTVTNVIRNPSREIEILATDFIKITWPAIQNKNDISVVLTGDKTIDSVLTGFRKFFIGVPVKAIHEIGAKWITLRLEGFVGGINSNKAVIWADVSTIGNGKFTIDTLNSMITNPNTMLISTLDITCQLLEAPSKPAQLWFEFSGHVGNDVKSSSGSPISGSINIGRIIALLDLFGQKVNLYSLLSPFLPNTKSHNIYESNAISTLLIDLLDYVSFSSTTISTCVSKQRQYRYYLKNEMFSGIGNDACSSGMSALTQYVVRNCAPSVGSSSEGFLYKTDLFEALDCGFDNPTMSVYTSSSCTPTSKVFSASVPVQKSCVNGALLSCERGSPPIPTSGKVIDTFNSNDCSGTILVSSHVTSMQNIYTLCDSVAKLSYTCGLDGSIIRKSHASGTTCSSFENQYFVPGVGVDTLADTSVCVSQQGFESSNRLTCRPFEPQVFIAGSDECISEATVQSQTPGIILPLYLGICKLYSPNTAYKLYNCDENGADIAIYKSVGASRGLEVTNCEGIATDSLRLYVNDKTNQFHPNFGVCDVSGKFENNKVQLAAMNCPAKSSSGVMNLISDGFFFKDKTPCAIGSYSSSIFGEIQCILCPAGTYSSTIGSSTCIPCNPGTYSTTIGAISSSVCAQCAAGSYSKAYGSTSCSSCIGSYSSTSGSSSCILCSAGYYSSTVGATSSSTCVSCPSNTYSYAGSSSCSSCSSGTTYISSSLGCKPSSTTSVGPIDTSFYLSGIDSEGISAFSSTTSSMSGITYSTSTSSYPSSAIIVSSGSYLSTSLLSTLPTGSSPFTISSWVKCDASSLSDVNPSSVVIAWGNIGEMSTSTSHTAATLAVTSKERVDARVSTVVNTVSLSPFSLAIDSSENFYGVLSSRIIKISSIGVVTTLAGNGYSGFADGIGSNAMFNGPQGLVADMAGNVYVADSLNNRIRKISPSGFVSTFAGSGEAGFADGTGTHAKFRFQAPVVFGLGITIDSSGNLLLADRGNHRIRKITPSGVVTTIAGSGSPGFADGVGTNAMFNSPQGLAVDTFGNIYVADTLNIRIRKITPSGSVTTFAGNGYSGFADGVGTNAAFPSSLSRITISLNTLYVTDNTNKFVRKITSTGVVTTIAGSGILGLQDGIGTNAQFYLLGGIAANSLGDIFIIDRNIRKISAPVPGPLPVCDSTWHHISLTYSGSSSTHILTAYFDGSFIGNILSTYSISSSTSSTSSLRIGTNGNIINSEYYTGSISDIRIYSRALSSNEIVSLSQPYLASYDNAINPSPIASSNIYTWYCISGYYGPIVTLSRSSSDGSWSSSSGSVNCQSCSAGTYSRAGSISCSSCIGSYSSTSASSSCILCSAGYYSSTVGATSSSTCVSCPSNTYSYAGSSSCSSCSSGTTYISSSLGCKPSSTTSVGPIDTSFYLSGIDSDGISAFSSTTSSMSGITYSTSSSSYPSSAIIISSGSYLSTSLLSTLPTDSSPFTISSWVKCDASSLSDVNPSSVVVAWGNIGELSTSTSLTAASLAVTSKERVNMIATVSTHI